MALAYAASSLNYPGYVDPRVPYWHLVMHMHMDITRLLVEGREETHRCTALS